VELIGLREAWTMKGILAEESPPELSYGCNAIHVY
jgi:hypothetical protein